MCMPEFYIFDKRGLLQAAAFIRPSVEPSVFVKSLHIHCFLPALSSMSIKSDSFRNGPFPRRSKSPVPATPTQRPTWVFPLDASDVQVLCHLLLQHVVLSTLLSQGPLVLKQSARGRGGGGGISTLKSQLTPNGGYLCAFLL